MPSAGKNFLTAFEKSYGQSASEFQRQQNQIENENRIAQREKELQDYRQNLKDIEDQKQQRLLSELLNGTTSDLGPRFAPTLQGNQLIGGQQPQQIVNRELTPQEKISKIVGLNPQYRTFYENQLKQKATADLQNQENQAFQNYLRNPQGFDYGQASTKTLQRIADYQKITKPSKPQPVSLGLSSDSKHNRLINLRGYENPNASEDDPSTRVINGKKYTITGESSMGKLYSTNENGQKDFAQGIKALYNSYYSTQQKYLQELNTGLDATGTPLDEDSRKNIENTLVQFNKGYVKHILTNAPKEARDFYKDMYNNFKGTPSKQNFWNNVVSAYTSGNLGKNKKDELLVMRHLAELYKALYNSTPANDFPNGLTTPDSEDDNAE